MAIVIHTIAIISFHTDETPYEWSISMRIPTPVKLIIERTVTMVVIALGKHWTNWDHTMPIANEMSMLSFMESKTSRKPHFWLRFAVAISFSVAASSLGAQKPPSLSKLTEAE